MAAGEAPNVGERLREPEAEIMKLNVVTLCQNLLMAFRLTLFVISSHMTKRPPRIGAFTANHLCRSLRITS
jgi:hypothetical protein